MVVDLPRRWRWVVAGLSASVALLAVLFVLLARTAERAAAVPPLSAEVLHAPPVEVAPLVEPAVSAEAPEPGRGVDEVEVCGAGWIAAKPDGTYDETAVERLDQLIGPPRERVLADLRAADDELSQASAQLLADLRDGSPPPDALVQLALSTTDPKVYGLVYRQCIGRHAGEGACRMLNAARWAQLDPENASPWFFLLGEASARNDRAAQQEALHRIASAGRDETGYFLAAGAVLAAATDDELSQLGATLLITQAIGMEGAVGLPAYQTVLASCRGDALRDANRQQTCAAVAELMVERSDTLLERSVGSAIGRQVGWAADRVDRVGAENAAYMNRRPMVAVVTQDLSCTAIRQLLDDARHVAAVGEVGALRAWIARSGRLAADLMREERERQALRSVPRPP